jgi:hypothetical protein
MKEFREFRKFKCEYGTTLTVTTLILSVAQSDTADRSFGVKLEHVSDHLDESCLLDFDEILELLGAIKYIFNAAKELKGQVRDYTEFVYSTKESMRVGFYQTAVGKQQAFIDVEPGGKVMFVTFDQMRDLFNVLKDAREHLSQCGAGDDGSRSTRT